jgi:methyltransferase (TIGR00027 family)
LHVFEVDHPDTQAWKRLRLAEVDLTVPETMTFVPVDFERQSLEDALPAAGFDPGAPSFFAWLGVTLYLPADAVRATLRSFVALTEGFGAVVFDYAIAPHLLTPLQREVFDAFAARVAAAGEPVRSAFEPAALREDLLAMGFQRAEDFGAEALNEKYFAGRTDGLRVGSLAHLMKAERHS